MRALDINLSAEPYRNDLPIVLAHLGRQLRADDPGSRAVRAIADLPNVAMDCSMATDGEVYRLVFDVLGPERVLYGSDQPMNLLRFLPVEDPVLGRRLASHRPYHWLSDELFARYRSQARDARLAHWQVLSALDEGISSVFGSEAGEVRQRVFHDNALEVYPAFGPAAT